MNKIFTANDWAKVFELALMAAAKLQIFAENLWQLYQKIKEDNSLAFCGPLRVPFVLAEISELDYLPSEHAHLLDSTKP